MLPSPTPARIVARHRDRWIALPDEGGPPVPARPSGRLLHLLEGDAALPVVGDRVDLETAGDADVARIVHVHPRRSAIRREAPGGGVQLLAANVDVALIVLSAAHGVSPRRLERWCTLAWEGGVTPVVVLAKADACPDPAAAAAAARAAAPGVDVVALSAQTGDGLDALAPWLTPGTTLVLLGASGVGKSTLANRLLGREAIRTAAVREDGAGRHTTTHRELFLLPGGAALIDTPGLRELARWGEEGEAGLDAAFADVAALAASCRFGDCGHAGEPGCAVLEAVADGRLPADRLESWRTLRREQAWLARRDDPAERSRLAAEGRRMQRLLRAHPRYRRDE